MDNIKVLHFKVTEELHKAIKARAAERGMTMQDFVKECLESGAQIVLDRHHPAPLVFPKGVNTYIGDNLDSPKNYSGADVPWKEVESVVTPDCCQNRRTRCKHWVWDTATGEGYVNTITGEIMEVN